MDMKINALLIKQMREARAWSQEHLAEVSNLSLRTIQRIESYGSASAESRLAIASALGVPVETLNIAELAARIEEKPLSAPAKNERGFYFKSLRYVLVCGAMFAGDYLSDGHVSWAYWPALGWGVAMLCSRVSAAF